MDNILPFLRRKILSHSEPLRLNAFELIHSDF